VCVCVCLYIHNRIYKRARTHTHKHPHMHTHHDPLTHAHKHTHTHTNTHTHTHTRIVFCGQMASETNPLQMTRTYGFYMYFLINIFYCIHQDSKLWAPGKLDEALVNDQDPWIDNRTTLHYE
jgi:hypothetical protein